MEIFFFYIVIILLSTTLIWLIMFSLEKKEVKAMNDSCKFNVQDTWKVIDKTCSVHLRWSLWMTWSLRKKISELLWKLFRNLKIIKVWEFPRKLISIEVFVIYKLSLVCHLTTKAFIINSFAIVEIKIVFFGFFGCWHDKKYFSQFGVESSTEMCFSKIF